MTHILLEKVQSRVFTAKRSEPQAVTSKETGYISVSNAKAEINHSDYKRNNTYKKGGNGFFRFFVHNDNS